MTVVVDGATRLERVSENDGISSFAEVYYGWPTGRIYEHASEDSSIDIAEAFKRDRVTA